MFNCERFNILLCYKKKRAYKLTGKQTNIDVCFVPYLKKTQAYLDAFNQQLHI